MSQPVEIQAGHLVLMKIKKPSFLSIGKFQQVHSLINGHSNEIHTL